MKIRVMHESGATEVIELPLGASTVFDGVRLDRIQSGNMEHFFTKDGYYDGWGAAVSATADEAREIIEAVESERVIEQADAQRGER